MADGDAPTERDLDAEAQEALDAARLLPRGAERSEALRKAGMLRRAADAAYGIKFKKKRGGKRSKFGLKDQPASQAADHRREEALSPDAGSTVTNESERPKEIKTDEDLAAMIRDDLSKIDGCPQRGVSVTVYGLPWKAMLMFGVEAGPVRNKEELKRFFDVIVERLQRLYDVQPM